MQHSAQLQLNDLWGILIGIVLFILMLGWREIADWLRVGVNRFVIVRRIDMSSAGAWEDDENDVVDVTATTATTQQQWIATPQNDSNAVLLQRDAATLAKLVKAGAIGETKGLQIVFGVRPSSTNPRYLAARDALKAELAKLEPGAQFIQQDGTIGPASYPVSGRQPSRTHAR